MRRPTLIRNVGGHRSWRGALAGIALAAWLSPALAAGPSLALDAAAQDRIGIRTVTLTAQRHASQIDAFAKVLDPGPLAQLQSDLTAAEAAAVASKAQAARSKALNTSGGSVALKDVEAAVAQAASDAEHVAQLRRRLGLEWGPGVARLRDAQRLALIGQIARGGAALVHVDTPSNEGQAGARSVEIDVGSGSAHGVVLGPARAAEPRLQSSGLIVKVTGPLAVLLSVGLTQSAHINTTDAVTGVLLPRSAVVRFEGSDWAYVRRGGAQFERRLINAPIPEDKGIFVTAGFQPGEQVISQGAAEVFAVERTQIMRAR